MASHLSPRYNYPMRYIVRKFIDATSAEEALRKEPSTPIHEVYLQNPEEKEKVNTHAIGFHHDTDPNWRDDEIIARRNDRGHRRN